MIIKIIHLIFWSKQTDVRIKWNFWGIIYHQSTLAPFKFVLLSFFLMNHFLWFVSKITSKTQLLYFQFHVTLNLIRTSAGSNIEKLLFKPLSLEWILFSSILKFYPLKFLWFTYQWITFEPNVTKKEQMVNPIATLFIY